MSEASLRRRRRVLDAWGYLCVVCGRRFANLACVTFEHVVPQSFSKKKKRLMGRENIAPSHHRCNKLRGSGSIMAAARAVDDREKRMHCDSFVAWLNIAVPDRTASADALRPLHQPPCLEPPERLSSSYLR